MTNTSEETQSSKSFFDLLEAFWKRKWSFVTITGAFAALSLVLGYSLPASYLYRVNLKPALESEFLNLAAFNDLMVQNKLNITLPETKPNFIDSGYIYSLFIEEFSDKREFQDIILNDPEISATVKLGNDDAQRAASLKALSSSFNVRQNNSRDAETLPHYLEFRWKDKNEGQYILSQVFKKTLDSTRQRVIKNLETIAKTAELGRMLSIESLKNEMTALNDFGVVLMQQRIAVLSEQAKIARELGIEGTAVERFDASEKSYPLDFDPNGTPLYMRGYKALEIEVANLQTKVKNKSTLGYAPYLNAQRDLFLLEKDNFSDKIKSHIAMLENQIDVSNWIAYDLNVVEPQKSPSKLAILILGVLAGFATSLVYVLYREHKVA